MSSEKNKTTAGLLGSGAGVGVVYFANQIEAGALRETVLYLSPVAAVAVTTIATWITIFGSREIQLYYRKRDLKRGRAHLKEILEDPNSSQSHKDAATAKVQSKELAVLDLTMEIVTPP